MEYQNFKLEIDEQGIAVFTANRPEKMNALNDLSWAEMNQFFTWADKADEVKVIIVTGAGEKAFIAGADLNSLKTKKSTDWLRRRRTESTGSDPEMLQTSDRGSKWICIWRRL